MKYNSLILVVLFFIAGIFESSAQRREYNHIKRQTIGGYNVYFGTLHNHSNVSDGLGTPNDAYYYAYRYSDMDFYSLADHSPWIEPTEWEAMKIAADECNKPGEFVTFRGFEWSGNGHVAVINSEGYCSNKAKPTDTFSGLLDWMKDNECVAFFNHPGREDEAHDEFNHFTDTPLDNFVGMELWNGRNEFSRYYYNDGFFPNDNKKSFYDEANSRGWKVGASGSEDNHRGDHGNYTQKRLAILADTLTRDALYEAFKARRFYSTLDKTLALSFKMGDHEMGATIKSGTYNFSVTASDTENEIFTIVQIYKNGIRLNEWNIIDTDVSITGTIDTSPGDYFYAKITQQDGNEAISSPIFINE